MPLAEKFVHDTMYHEFVFCLTGSYLTRRATFGRLELIPGEGRFVYLPLSRVVTFSLVFTPLCLSK